MSQVAAMHLSERSINAIQFVITGNETPNGEVVAPYRSGPMLVEFFNEFGRDDVYGQGFPSRHVYAKDALRSFRDSDELVAVVEAVFDPAHFLDFEPGIEPAVDYVNKYLAYDGFQLVHSRRGFRLSDGGESLVEVENSNLADDPLAQEFIEEQIYKCHGKIREEDYDGAITNARSLLEAVLSEIERQVVEDPPKPDGDLGRLFKRVQKKLNLEPTRTDISDSLKQVLRGLANIVNGIAPIRNRMSDAHARSYKPARHHAKFAVNAAQTACDFLVETYHHQLRKGLIVAVGRDE